MNLIRLLVEILVAVVIIPVVAVQTATAQNISATTKTIFGIFEILLAVGVLYVIAKEIGIGQK